MPAEPAVSGPAAGRARSRTFTGSPLGGTVVVTVTPLDQRRHDERGSRDRRARRHAESRRRKPSARPCATAGPVREACLARPVRRRHRARDQQPAAGRARHLELLMRSSTEAQASGPTLRRDPPRSGSRGEDRAQPAGLHRLRARIARLTSQALDLARRSPAARPALPSAISKSSAGSRRRRPPRRSATPLISSRRSSTS